MQNLLLIIVKHEGIIHRTCRYYTNTEEDHKDLFQDIIFEILKSFPTFKNESKITTWMYSVASNTAIRHLKMSKRRPDQYVIDNKTLLIKEDTVENVLEEKIAELHNAISLLDENDKIIASELLKKSPVNEIAEKMNITPNNTRVKMYRVRKRLKKILLNNTYTGI